MKPEPVIPPDQMPADVLEAIREGRKIEAIKVLREKTGLGLANAKVLVDRAWREHGPERPIPSFTDQPSGPGRLIVSLVIFLTLASFWFIYTGT